MGGRLGLSQLQVQLSKVERARTVGIHGREQSRHLAGSRLQSMCAGCMLAAGWERRWLEGRARSCGVVRLESEGYQAALELLLGDLAVVVAIPLQSGAQSQKGCCR